MLTGLAGPLAVEGGKLGDRALKTALKLPGEKDAALFAIRTQPPENQQIDVLNIFDDLRTTNGSGAMTAINLSGFGMAGSLTGFPAGISWANPVTSLSTIEVINILLGSGVDTLTINGTLIPGADLGGIVANHGGLTVVHGGGGSDTITIFGGGGATAPLVIYGDTSQDGIWYSGSASEIISLDFGAKPFDQIGTDDDHFIFPLAVPFTNHGDDTINAQALTGATGWTVGLTIYGGQGNDTIYGSQTGDHLAGGSGDDHIYGQGGPDLIYGDSGVNVNILTRALTIPTSNASTLGTADGLTAGSDTIEGNAGDDVIFGDHGIVDQNTAEPNLPDARLQKIQTTGVIKRIETDLPGNGAVDTIYGNEGSDRIFGGPAADYIYGGEGANILFGDLGYIDYGVEDTQIDDLASTDYATGGSDIITAGSGNDILVGGPSGDSLTAGDGTNLIFGDNGRVRSSSSTTAVRLSSAQRLQSDPRLCRDPLCHERRE